MHSQQYSRILVVDPIPFLGGSKIASESVLNILKDRGHQIDVFTRNPDFWRSYGYAVHALYEPECLETAETGIPYFIKHFVIWIQVYLWLLVNRGVGLVMGISGPGVDLSIYWVAAMSHCKAVQLVHGPVANSNTIRRVFRQASLVACLESEYQGVKVLLQGSTVKLESMINGLTKTRWPQSLECHFDKPRIFWNASLLKWKGLDAFMSAYNALDEQPPYEAVVCYIRPKGTLQEVSAPPTATKNLHVFENPSNLNSLRSHCNIFVSSSTKEPFGLSILEALASGLCVVIPSDGAYWDLHLEDRVNCIKYNPESERGLAEVLHWLGSHMDMAKRVSRRGKRMSFEYEATKQYRHIINDVEYLSAAEVRRVS